MYNKLYNSVFSFRNCTQEQGSMIKKGMPLTPKKLSIEKSLDSHVGKGSICATDKLSFSQSGYKIIEWKFRLFDRYGTYLNSEIQAMKSPVVMINRLQLNNGVIPEKITDIRGDTAFNYAISSTETVYTGVIDNMFLRAISIPSLFVIAALSGYATEWDFYENQTDDKLLYMRENLLLDFYNGRIDDIFVHLYESNNALNQRTLDLMEKCINIKEGGERIHPGRFIVAMCDIQRWILGTEKDYDPTYMSRSNILDYIIDFHNQFGNMKCRNELLVIEYGKDKTLDYVLYNTDHLKIPDGITSINSMCLRGCKSIVVLTLPDSLINFQPFFLKGTYASLRYISLNKVNYGYEFFYNQFTNKIFMQESVLQRIALRGYNWSGDKAEMYKLANSGELYRMRQNNV